MFRKKKRNTIKNKIPNATNSIHINQYNTDKKIQRTKIEILIKNTRYGWFSDCNYFEYKN